MALHDGYGNPISTTSTAARDAFDRGVNRFLSAQPGSGDEFAAAIAADPEFALAHVGAARAAMMSAQMPDARAAIARAEALAHTATPREQRHIAALAALLSGQAPRARTMIEAHARDHPRDTLAVQMCTSVFGLIGFSGERGREAEHLAYTAALLPHYEGDWWMMSMHAISLCEVGCLDASLTLMERSLELNPDNANAVHFKAHALYEAGDADTGRAFLTGWLDGYERRGVLHGHLSWHAALWSLHAGDTDTMWSIVDGCVVPGKSQGMPINTMTDTAAIYYRAEMAGHAVDPARWAAISDYAAQHFPDPGQSFADFHAALCHAMAGHGDRLARIAETTRGFAADLVAPAARAWGAIARGDWAGALADLTPALAGTERFGGSRAQRDLLELTYVNVLLKLGLGAEARRTLATRRPVLTEQTPVAGLA